MPVADFSNGVFSVKLKATFSAVHKNFVKGQLAIIEIIIQVFMRTVKSAARYH